LPSQDNRHSKQPVNRHFGMDWLRIGAFALLIAYHVAMVFVPWGWHIKTQEPVGWLVYPMLALNPWRLSLLFLVSGFASRAMLSKSDISLGRFLGQRTARLLVPLLFGILVIIPPQSWAECVQAERYRAVFSRSGWENISLLARSAE